MQVVKVDEISKELEGKMQELKSLIDTFKVRSRSSILCITTRAHSYMISLETQFGRD